jgi:hypothetical protein
MEITEKKVWSPYWAGALSGVLSILSVWVAGKYFGATATSDRGQSCCVFLIKFGGTQIDFDDFLIVADIFWLAVGEFLSFV